MPEALFNQWIGNVKADLTISGTSCLVAPVPVGPEATDTWRMLLGSEWIKVTHTLDNGNGTATLTIARAQEGSTATAHPSGRLARSVFTAASVSNLLTIEEVDGSPSLEGARKLQLPNGTVTTSGTTATYAPFNDAEGDPANVASSAADGTSVRSARRDHVHTIGAGVVTDSHVASANKDGTTSTPSMRTLGTGSAQAAAGDHNHTLDGLSNVDMTGKDDGDVASWSTGAGKWVPTAPSGGSGDVATDTIFDAKGDLPVGTGANTASKLPVGSNGQILTADSGETTGVKWAAAGSGSVAADTIFDAKGDLAVGTGADTASKLTAGANDTILMADSAQSTGLKWVASQTPSTQAFSDSAAQGTADTYARGDHVHGMPASPGGLTAIPTWSYKRTAGSYTPGAGSAYVDLDGTNLAGSLAAAIGDVLEFCLSAFANAACYFDVQMTTSGNYVACSGGGSDQGVVAWTGSRAGGGGGVLYTVVSGDISGGNVAFKLRVNPNGTSPTVFGTNAVPLMFSAKNLKH